MLSRRQFISQNGFTIIELLVAIVIIGILATIGTLNYGNYQKSLTVSQVKSDLNGVNAAMENARTFKDAYPTYVADLAATTPPTFTSSPTVTLSGGSYDGGKTYCVDAVSSRDPSVKYYIDSNNGLQGAQIGSCAFAHPVPTNLLATKASNTLLNLSWDAVPGATNYTLQRDTAATFTSGALTIISGASTTTPSTVVQGVNYYYRVNATLPDMTSGWSDAISANTNINPPTVPVVAVALNAGNALASISNTPTCSTGTVQYAFRSRTNNGTWGGYSTWGATSTASQVAVQGVKFDYDAQARCYVDATLFGSSSTSLVATYVHPITTVPATPAVGASVPNWATTTYTWNATSCVAGSTARYQYYFSTSYGYNSGWVAIAGTSINLTTSSSGYTYTLQVQSQCYSTFYPVGGPWSASGSASYYRPYTVTVLVVAGGAGGGAGDSYGNGGGGGAGGYIYQTDFAVAKQSYGVTVGGYGGGGGTGGGGNGANSIFSSLTAIGGGGGGGGSSNKSGFSGGSGGGASASSSSNTNGSAGTSGQGNSGGNSCANGNRTAGGGGGATGGNYYFNGGCISSSRAGDGGTGIVFSITGSSVCYSGGGGGGIGSGTEGNGGTSISNGGGITCGAGRAHQTGSGESALANTGSGGGGGKGSGGNGGSGIVIVRYNNATMNADGGSKYANGSDYVHVFTGSGTLTVY